jgi:hypothetical protein
VAAGVVGLISGPVLGRGGGKGEVKSDAVFVLGGALSGVESEPVFGRGGGKGGVGSAPVRGRGKGEEASAAGVARGGGTRKEAVNLLIWVGAPEGRPGEVLPEAVGGDTGSVTFRESGVKSGGRRNGPEEVSGGWGASDGGVFASTRAGGNGAGGGVAAAGLGSPMRDCVAGNAGGRD